MIVLSIIAEFVGWAVLVAFGLLLLYVLLWFILNGIIIAILVVAQAVEWAYYKLKEIKENE